MSRTKDLTRWNRAGLSRFRYVDGNAPTHLELLRLQALERFGSREAEPGAGGWPQPDPGPKPGEEQGSSDWLQRVTKQYRGPRRDPGWELLRTLAGACHVLTEHLDVFANEGFIQTATQWENVRRLVHMLSYRPAPPASAATHLALLAKPGRQGKVEPGFQVKHTPEQSAPVVFETLEEATVDSRLNGLRLDGFGRSPEPVSGERLLLEGEIKGVRLGDPVLLQDERTHRLRAHLIRGVRAGEQGTALQVEPRIARREGFTAGFMQASLVPRERLPLLGPVRKGVERAGRGLRLKRPPEGLAPGVRVFVGDGTHMYYRVVQEIRGREVRLHEPIANIDFESGFLSRARTVSALSQGGRSTEEGRSIVAVRVSGDLSFLAEPTTWVAHFVKARLRHFKVFAAPYQPFDPERPEAGGSTTVKLEDPDGALRNPQTLLVPPAGRQWGLDPFLDPKGQPLLPRTLQTKIPERISAGAVVAVVSSGQLAWGAVEHVEVREGEGFALLTVDRWRHRGGGRMYLSETRLMGPFSRGARLLGWRENQSPVRGSQLALGDADAASLLASGRRLILETGEPGGGQLVRVRSVSGRTLRVSPEIRAEAGLTVSNTLVRGNVALAGHGESKPQRILGSGDATRGGQSFVLRERDVSHPRDASGAAGVRAAVEVAVEGRVWEQVDSLRGSGPADARYEVALTEEGHLRITFGDGSRGRRLPSGENNVRVRYRVGTGSCGNLEPGSLTSPVRPHALVEGILQPLPATGGNGAEGTRSLRSRAPRTVLTLQRAVSLADFAHLASAYSGIWQAEASPLPPSGRSERVRVVVVPAEGLPLGELGKDLREFLQLRAQPGTVVVLEEHEPVLCRMEIVLRIRTSEIDPQAVRQEARLRLLETFSLRRRRIGQDLYLSEIYQAAESVPGVRNSHCALDLAQPAAQKSLRSAVPASGRGYRVLRPERNAVLYLSGDGNGLVLSHEELEL